MQKILFIMGIGDGNLISGYIDAHPEHEAVYAYEPDENKYLAFEKSETGKKLIENVRFHPLHPGLDYDIRDFINEGIDYHSLGYLVLPGYDPKSKEALEFYDDIKFAIDICSAHECTNRLFCVRSADNELSNLPIMIEQRNVLQLTEKLQSMNLEGYPGIVVSSGPSLDKNIKDLKAAHGKAFIVAVDGAIKSCLREGIRIDVAVCIDPGKEEILFSEPGTENIPFIFSKDAPSKLAKRLKNSIFFSSYMRDDIPSSMAQKCGLPGYIELESGGSVAHSACSFLKKCGFRNIILVGQDLAYTGGIGHAKDAYDDDRYNAEFAARNGVVQVEGIDGQMVLTAENMAFYIRWFERFIQHNPDIHIVDATEGGALIRGTEIATLKAAIDHYCNKEADFEAVVAGIEPYYSGENRDTAIEYLAGIEKMAKEVRVRSQEADRLYEDLKMIIKGRKKGNVKAILDKTRVLVTEIESSEILYLIMNYVADDEYDVKNEMVSTECGDALREIGMAQKLVKSYCRGAQRIIEKASEIGL